MGIKIYFAGPLFTIYEREWITHTASLLRSNGFDPFVPIENPFHPEDHPEISHQKLCFDKDFSGIADSNAMLVNLNGYEVDDGTATEIGVFYVLQKTDPTKKGIIAYHDDWRAQTDGDGKGLNLFLRGCIEDIGFITADMNDAIEQLRIWQADLIAEGQILEDLKK
jgi:nucleoside 2-deoxyribosyltransferase